MPFALERALVGDEIMRTRAIAFFFALLSCRSTHPSAVPDAAADRSEEARAAEIDAGRQMWNETYRDGRAFVPQPSRFLMKMVEGRKPGAALDVMMGQGRNALYLASQGWAVTGVDISDEGIRQARDAAARRGLRIDAINADIATWDWGKERWDLVVLIYSGCGPEMAEKVRESLKPGGIVVVEGYHKDAVPIGYEAGELATVFKGGFSVLKDEVVTDMADWGTRTAPEKLVRFAAQKR